MKKNQSQRSFKSRPIRSHWTLASSVTILGDLLHFGQLFKACGNTYFAQIAHILGNFCRGVKIFHFSSGIIFGQLLQTFGDFLLVTRLASRHLWEGFLLNFLLLISIIGVVFGLVMTTPTTTTFLFVLTASELFCIYQPRR